jgi:hypothetical protein
MNRSSFHGEVPPIKFLDWAGHLSMMTVGWVGQDCFSGEFEFHNAPEGA